MTDSYDDIIDRPRPTSSNRPRMPRMKRAAQFAPFAALTGFEEAIKEAARLTDRRIELDEYLKDALNEKLRVLAERIQEHPEVELTYFRPDAKKKGGAYVTVKGPAKKVDIYKRFVIMMDGTKIPMEEVLQLDFLLR